MNHHQRTAVGFTYFLVGVMFYTAPCFCFGEMSLKEIRSEYKREDLQGRLVLMQALDGRTDCETVDFLMVVAGSGWENWQVKIKAIQFLGENFSTAKNSTGRASLSLILNKEGNISLSGPMGIDPLSADL